MLPMGVRRMTLRSPLDSLLDVRREMDRVFDRALPSYDEGQVWTWPAEVFETDEELRFLIEAPGMRAEDIDLTIENNVLTVSGEKRSEHEREEKGEYRLVERRFGRFERNFTLPSNVATDAVKASYADGILRVVLPKKEESKPRRIRIQPESGQRIESA